MKKRDISTVQQADDIEYSFESSQKLSKQILADWIYTSFNIKPKMWLFLPTVSFGSYLF